MQHSERLWPARLRWRLRGAWLWPAFFGLTLLDGLLLWRLPPYDGAPRDLVAGVLLAGFANLLVVAIGAPLVGKRLRRVRQDLPRPVALDYAGTALLGMLAVVVAAAGLAHRPAVVARQQAESAMHGAVRGYVSRQEPDWSAGLAHVDALRLAEDSYRACVPGADPRRWLCLIVDTDQHPPGVIRDPSMEPNSALRTVGGFH